MNNIGLSLYDSQIQRQPLTCLPHSFREDLNVVVAFKAMGIESDQEIVQMVGSEPALVPLFMPTLQECNQLGIHSQQQALEYMGNQP